jgi:hypothetical protein
MEVGKLLVSGNVEVYIFSSWGCCGDRVAQFEVSRRFYND